MPHRLHTAKFGPVHALPILHYKMEFASLVRKAFDHLKPDCMAIELPPSLEAPFLRCVARLPEISVLMYDLASGKNKGETVSLLIEPADPLVEAARLALSNNVPIHLVDVDIDDYPAHQDYLPDSYAIRRIGLKAYYDAYLESVGGSEPSNEDLRRERGMAWRLQGLAEKHQNILFVCGMSHLARIREMFDHPQAAPLERVKRENVRLINLHPDSCREVLGEMPFLSAVYEMRRGDLPPEPAGKGPALRKSYSAFELIRGGKKEVPEEEILWESILRSAHHAGDVMVDRQRVMLRLFQEVARHYRQETGEPVHIWQKRAFFKYARNYALISGSLIPDLFQILAAGRGCIDDNFAYALWRLATLYPWQKEQSGLPTMRLSPDDLWGTSRRIRFRPKQKRQAKGLSHLRFLQRKRERRPGEWLEGFSNPSICSYPPEDIVIENYGRFLKKRGAKQLSEEQSRVERFTTSLLDGIDMRETIRNLPEGKIYVRENQRIKGGVGGVVVIFDEDRQGDRFPYLMTWLGEHEQESDMAFYGTPPSDNIVGPGISRCEYGGFLLSYPPRRMADVWSDPDYRFARSKGEVLLIAALDYSIETNVVLVSAKPPRSYFRQLAARLGKKIIHIPLGSLSPVKVKKIRVFHVLAGHDKREIAKDYVW